MTLGRNNSLFSLQSFCKVLTKGVVATVLSIFTLSSSLTAQLVTTGDNATNLVQNVLIGQGITVSNITFSGSSNQIGSFTYGGGNPSMGLTSGIILSSGRISDGQGANTSASVGVDFNRTGDATLDAILPPGPGAVTRDAAILEFDFVPQSANVAFRYVFASEEYPEFVGSQYNDVFGFFISGPGITGQQNIALIPGTGISVAINNVNQTAFNNYYRDNTGGASTQYDGFTAVLSTNTNLVVVPCSTYRIKIAIADVADGIYDSAVLLEASSFTSASQEIGVSVTYGTDSTKVYEGCGQANIKFTKTLLTNTADSIQVFISGTATNGADYNSNGQPFPTWAVFPPNSLTTTIPLTAVLDGISEPNETITISIQQQICGQTITKTINLTVVNVNPIVITSSPNDTIDCPNVALPISAFVSGGISPYAYSWDGGQTSQSITVFPQQTTTYTVNVTDDCQSQTGQSQTTIYLLNYIPLALISTPDTNICPGDSVLLTAVGSGGRGGPLKYTYTWSDSLGNGQSVWVNPNVTTTYSVTLADSCGTTVTNFIIVDVLPTNADFDYYYIQNRIVKFQDLSSNDVLYWYWDFGDGDTSRAQSPLHTYADTGLYKVTLVVENKYGCTDTIVRFIRAYPDYALYVPNAFTPNGDGVNENFSAVGEGFVTFELYIFNRWGEQIYGSTDYARPWDGRDKSGQISPQGIYVYLIRIKTPPGDEYTLRGSVALIN